jgi:thiamine kinase-like enzyme
VLNAVDERQPLVNDASLLEVIGRVPRLAQATHLEAEKLPGGLTNSNYLVTADETRYVVRVAAGDAAMYGIDRWREGVALLAAAAAGIAPGPVEFLLPEGHLVTRYLADAHTLSLEAFTSETMIPRVARRLRDVHQLESIDGSFDPYDDIRRWMDVITMRGTTRPTRLTPLLRRVAATEAQRAGAYTPVLCHNDPYHRNFLDDGTLWILDWEHAGMGDPMYDLGGAAYPLSRSGRDMLLHAYFGEVDDRARRDLDRLVGVYLCWNVVWCLLQVENGAADFDYRGFADELLDLVPATP